MRKYMRKRANTPLSSTVDWHRSKNPRSPFPDHRASVIHSHSAPPFTNTSNDPALAKQLRKSGASVAANRKTNMLARLGTCVISGFDTFVITGFGSCADFGCIFCGIPAVGSDSANGGVVGPLKAVAGDGGSDSGYKVTMGSGCGSDDS